MMIHCCRKVELLKKAEELKVTVTIRRQDLCHLFYTPIGTEEACKELYDYVQSLGCTEAHRQMLRDNADWYTKRGW